jgi:NADPH:quinone reductase-like Zn-dependent oxidoreductase
LSAAASGNTRSILHALLQLLRIKKYSPTKLMDDNKTVSGCNMGHMFGHTDILRPQFESLLKMYDAGQIKPYVDRAFSFEEAPKAHQYIHDRKAKGKVLLTP